MQDRRSVLQQLEREEAALCRVQEFRQAIQRQIETNKQILASHKQFQPSPPPPTTTTQQSFIQQKAQIHAMKLRAQQHAQASFTTYSIQDSTEGNYLIPILPSVS